MSYSVDDVISIPGKGVARVLSVLKLQPTPDDEPYFWCKLEFYVTRYGTIPSRGEIVRHRAIKAGHPKVDTIPKGRNNWCFHKNELNRELLENKKDMFFLGG